MPLSRNLGTLTSWNPLRHSRPLTGLLCLYTHTHTYIYIYVCVCVCVVEFKHSASFLTIYIYIYIYTPSSHPLDFTDCTHCLTKCLVNFSSLQPANGSKSQTSLTNRPSRSNYCTTGKTADPPLLCAHTHPPLGKQACVTRPKNKGVCSVSGCS